MSRPRVSGLDLSLTASGLACDLGCIEVFKPKTHGAERLVAIQDFIGQHLSADPPNVVVIENYSFGSPYSGERLGEVGGVIRAALWRSGIPYVEVPPAKMKKYATGKGNANKHDVEAAARKRSGMEFSDDNAADAWWLRQMGLAHYAPGSDGLVELPEAQLAVINAVAWPVLTSQ